MLAHAMMTAVLSLQVGVAPEPFKVDGATSMTVAKKAGYKLKCGEPLRFIVSGPANLHLDVRGHAETKAASLQLVRAEKFESDNVLALAKAKDGTKEFPLSAELNFSAPAGEQKYVLTCSEASPEILVFFDAPKKPVKKSLAATEKELPPPKPVVNPASTAGYPLLLGPTQF